jgi:dTDP-4-dehydrorhamnose reductase
MEYRPNVIINCTGITKHSSNADNPLIVLPINSLFPHKLVKLSKLIGARVIQISTDCVFSGDKGFYSEIDCPDSSDLYGISKSLGEVDYTNAITIRTSTIGHDKASNVGLLEWFLSQKSTCIGFNRAIFSGLPTVTLAWVIRDYILNDENLTGLYHLAAEPIDKLSLLKLIANIYKKNIQIVTDDSFIINRSLSAEKFSHATGYITPSWDVLIREMHNDFKEY